MEMDKIKTATLLELIEEYGSECAAGGQGYTATQEIEILEEIKIRVNRMTDEDLDKLIVNAMDSGIIHCLIPTETADRMRVRLAEALKRKDR